MAGYDAIVLAGGKGRRLGGVDKATLDIGSQPLLDRALDAVGRARRTIVVGPSRPLPAGIRTVVEDPPGGGPAAAITPEVIERLVATLSADARSEPSVDAAAVPDSPRAPRFDAALLVDGGGRRQFLAGAYRATSLRQAFADLGSPDGMAVHRLVTHFRITEVAADETVTLDCDTWDDIRLVRDKLEAP
jgi:molybdopterin-guanine dinucleotide biosynthesis protein A